MPKFLLFALLLMAPTGADAMERTPSSRDVETAKALEPVARDIAVFEWRNDGRGDILAVAGDARDDAETVRTLFGETGDVHFNEFAELVCLYLPNQLQSARVVLFDVSEWRADNAKIWGEAVCKKGKK